MAGASPHGETRCPQCGGDLSAGASLEGLCSACLLGLGLEPASPVEDPPPEDHRPATLHAAGPSLTARAWAAPVELLRQAARRLRDVALGLGAAFACSILLNSLLQAGGVHSFAHPTLKNALAAAMTVVSGAVAYLTHRRPPAPGPLFRLSFAYEVAVALAISIGDHLEPLHPDVPLANVSWVCVWIVIFPVVVPATPVRTLAASLAAASTWPLAHLIAVAAGQPPAPLRLLLLNSLEPFIAAALALATALLVGRLERLGYYHLERKIDQGGMGEIWRARHHLLARPVAVKLIRPELIGVKSPAEATALVARFRREAEATAALHSPHTIALHDFGMTPEGVFYYVMELLDGLDLDTLVRRFGPVPPERAVHLLVQACDSLADAHAAGLIHRDVKPKNLVSCRFGLKYDFVKVLDFGLVKGAWGLADDERLTSDGTFAGTPAFVAPEVALGASPLDARVDLYGLGCVAYWLLTGEKVFTGRTPLEVVLHHVKSEPVPPSRRAGRAFPEALEGLVLSCLAKDPNDRPPSAAWLGERLAACRFDEPWSPARARDWWESQVGPRPGAPDG